MLVYQAIRAWELWFGAVGGSGRAQLKKDVMRIRNGAEVADGRGIARQGAGGHT